MSPAGVAAGFREEPLLHAARASASARTSSFRTKRTVRHDRMVIRSCVMASNGTCNSRFDAVREEFERNFSERDEIGASVCVTLDGETVVDLWGGVADPATNRPWERDTIGQVWSNTKGAVSLCAHMLVSRALLDLDAPIARYWPE